MLRGIFPLFLPLADALAAFCAWMLARMIRPVTDLIPGVQTFFDPAFLPPASYMLWVAGWGALGYVALQLILGRYRLFSLSGQLSLWDQFLSSVLWGALQVSFWVFVYHELIFSRVMLVQAVVFTAVLGFGFRWLLISLERYLLGRFASLRTGIILLGDEDDRRRWRQTLSSESEWNILHEGGASPQDLQEAIDLAPSAHQVWCVSPELSLGSEDTMRHLCYEKALLWRLSPLGGRSYSYLNLDTIDGLPLMTPHVAGLAGWGRVLKRVFDLCASLLLLLLLFPPLLILGVWIWLWDRGPVFYKSTRVGRGGRPFALWKLRTMIPDADAQKKQLQELSHRDGPFFKIKNDPRVTPVGRVLRRFSLDELPQLWNVFAGDMSLIGPRPHLPDEVSEITPRLRRTLSIRPGITGLAQVSGRSDLSFERELELDVRYLEHWSPQMDLMILLRTPLVLLRGEGAD